MALTISLNEDYKNMSNKEIPAKIEGCASRHYEVKAKDLPLSCPMPDMYLWDAHPKVYLPIEETGEVLCPYCSAKYTLKNDDRFEF